MSYSSYGGAAWRHDGIDRLRVDRSDAFFLDGQIVSTPGSWPGFQHSAVADGTAQPYHVIIGEGKQYIGLFKQSGVKLWGFHPDLIADVARESARWALASPAKGHKGRECTLQQGGLRVAWWYDDNFYVGARIAARGVVWRGWSGYGVVANYRPEDGLNERVARKARMLLE